MGCKLAPHPPLRTTGSLPATLIGWMVQFSDAEKGWPPCVQYSVLPANASDVGSISGLDASTQMGIRRIKSVSSLWVRSQFRTAEAVRPLSVQDNMFPVSVSDDGAIPGPDASVRVPILSTATTACSSGRKLVSTIHATAPSLLTTISSTKLP